MHPVLKIMAKKLERRVAYLYARAKRKVLARKFNPPVRCRVISLQEQNKVVLDSVLSKISQK